MAELYRIVVRVVIHQGPRAAGKFCQTFDPIFQPLIMLSSGRCAALQKASEWRCSVYHGNHLTGGLKTLNGSFFFHSPFFSPWPSCLCLFKNGSQSVTECNVKCLWHYVGHKFTFQHGHFVPSHSCKWKMMVFVSILGWNSYDLIQVVLWNLLYLPRT